MKFIIETDRLLLREFILGDVEKFYQLNLNPNVIKYTENAAFKSIEEERNRSKHVAQRKLLG